MTRLLAYGTLGGPVTTINQLLYLVFDCMRYITLGPWSRGKIQHSATPRAVFPSRPGPSCNISHTAARGTITNTYYPQRAALSIIVKNRVLHYEHIVKNKTTHYRHVVKTKSSGYVLIFV